LDPCFPVVVGVDKGIFWTDLLPDSLSKFGLCILLALGLLPKRKSFRIVSVLFLSCPFLLFFPSLFSGELSPSLLLACRVLDVCPEEGRRGRFAAVAPLVDACFSDWEFLAPDLRFAFTTTGISSSSSLLLALKDEIFSLDCVEPFCGVGFVGMLWGSTREFEDPRVVRGGNLARASTNYFLKKTNFKYLLTRNNI
jgi:hypothetical protein